MIQSSIKKYFRCYSILSLVTLLFFSSITYVNAQTNYWWNGGSNTTTPANGGSGSWTGANNWRSVSPSGSQATWSNGAGNIATFSGTAGTVSVTAGITSAIDSFNTTGYTLTTTSAANQVLTGQILLGNNVGLTIKPFQTIGSINVTRITGSGIANLTISGTPSAVNNPAWVGMAIADSINVPITITNATGGITTWGCAGVVSKSAAGYAVVTGNITNNTVVKTMFGTGGFSYLKVNGIISGSADLVIQSKAAGGTGIVLLNNNNTYSGATILNSSDAAFSIPGLTGQSLQLGVDNALPTTTGLTFGAVSGQGGTFDLNGHNQSLAYITNIDPATTNNITNSVSSLKTLTINGASTYTLSTPISGGANLALAISGSGTTILSQTLTTTFTGGASTSATGTLQMGHASVLNSGLPITLNGGTFSTGATVGYSQSVNTLTLTDNSTLSLGTGSHTLNFADSHSQSWTTGKILTITGWQGAWNGTAGTAGQIFFGSSSSTLTAGQLSQIRFFDGTKYWVASLLSTGELVPIPSFTSGNLAVAIARNANNTGASIAELDTVTVNQASPVNTFAIDSTSGNALRFTGSGATSFYMANSDDKTLLCFTGANTTNTVPNINTIQSKGVGTFNYVAAHALATTYTGTGTNNTSCATTLDNSTWFITDQGGIYTNGATSSSPSSVAKGIKPFGGIVYCGSKTYSVQVSTIAAATGSLFVGLPGLPTSVNASFGDFYLISSGSNGSAYDVLYIVSNSSATVGTITKYSLVSGTWTANGSYATSFGGCALVAAKSGTGANLFVTTGVGSTASNSIIRLFDAAGYNATINITTGNNKTLFTVAGTIIKGIAFAPIAPVCNAPSISSVTNTGPICAGASISLASVATGTAPLTYSWSGAGTFNSTTIANPSVTSAATGNYSVTVSNACGSSTLSTAVTVNPLPTTYTVTGGGSYCSGGSGVAVGLSNSTAGVNYQLKNSSGNVGSPVAGTGSAISFSNQTTADTYSVVAANTTTSCTNNMTGSVTVAITPTVTPSVNISANPSSTICAGTSVTFTAAPTNGGGSPSYQWMLNGGSVGTNSTTYTNNSLANNDKVQCVLTSNATCALPVTANSNTITITITGSVIPAVSISATPGTTICPGTNVTFTAAPTNGGGSPSYQWMLGVNPVGTNSATYINNSLSNNDLVSCVMTSSNPCASPATANSNTITITVTPSVTPSVIISATPSTTICAGSNVTFTAAPTNGGSTPSYQWMLNGGNVGTNNTIYSNNSLANNDKVQCVLTSNAVCASPVTVNSNTITMTVNALATGTISPTTNELCHGGNIGSATVNASGGASPYTYSWSPSGGTNTLASGLTANNYTVLITDHIGCSNSQTVAITEPAALTYSISSNNVSCNGGNDGGATVSVSGGISPYTYSWSPYGGTNATAGGLTPNNYSLLITDHNGCNNTQTVAITEPAVLTFSVSSQTNVSCNGGSNGSATINVSGGASPYTYSWSPSGATSSTATGLSANSYNVIITDHNGCNNIQPVTITQPAVLTYSFSSIANVSCYGGNNGSITAVTSGGTSPYTYLWSPSGGTNATATGLTANNYVVAVTDAHGCAFQKKLIHYWDFNSTKDSTTAAPCAGSGLKQLSPLAADYSTLGNAHLVYDNSGTTPATCGCAHRDSILDNGLGGAGVNARSVLGNDTAAGGTGLCNSGNFYVRARNPSNNMNFLWYMPTTHFQNLKLTYATQRSGSGQAEQVFSYSLDSGATFTTAGLHAIGADSVSAPNTAVWNKVAIDFSSISGINNNPRFVFRIIFHGAPGATTTQTNGNNRFDNITLEGDTMVAIAITQPTVLTSTVSPGTNVSCHGGNNGSATVTAGGGTSPYTYSWSPSSGTSATASGLTANNYTVLITDHNGCNNTQTVSITEPTALTTSVSSQVNILCNGNNSGSATVNANGGTSPYTYSWSPSGGSSATASGLSANNYTVTITDNNNCTNTQTISITQPTVLTTSVFSQQNILCHGNNSGSATVSVGGGTSPYTYSWLPSGGTSASASGLNANNYSVTITDHNGCSNTQIVSITEPTVLTSTVTSANAHCNSADGSASVSASGGTGSYTYLWSNNQTTSSITGISASSYTVTVTDANGCSNVSVANISNIGAPNASITAQTNVTLCHGQSTGSATVSASGGTGTLTYSWNTIPVQSTTSVTSLAAGIYNVTVTDAAGCLVIVPVTITEPTAVTTTVTASNNVSCYGGNNGNATVAANGGTPSYTYSWSPSGGTNATASGLNANTYIVIVTDAHGCTSIQSVDISQPTILTTSVSIQSNVSCHGGIDGSTIVTPNGGTAPYTYSWLPSGGTNATASGLSANNYSVTVTDACGAIISASVTITQPTLLTDVVTATPATCGNNNGSVSASPSGGTSPYTYSWSNGNTTSAVTGLTGQPADTLVIHITDAHGCIHTDTTIVNCVLAVVENNPETDFSVYPNPNFGEFEVTMNSPATNDYVIELHNAIGQIIYSETLKTFTGKYSKKFDVRGLGEGIYFISIRSNGKQWFHKVIVYK